MIFNQKQIVMVLLAVMLLLAGCWEQLYVPEPILMPMRTVALDWRHDYSDVGYYEVKITELSDFIELTDAAAIVSVDELVSARADNRKVTFQYRITPQRILYDTTGKLTIGEGTEMTTGSGAITLSDVKSRLNSVGLNYISKEQGTCPDEDWLLTCRYDTTLIEVGGSYLLLLSYDEGWERFYEDSEHYIWEVIDDRLARSDGVSKWYDEEYAMEDVCAMMRSRAGRADEIGEQAYYAEVLARQKTELAEKQAALRTVADAAAGKRTGETVPMKKRRIVYRFISGRERTQYTLEEAIKQSNAVVVAKITGLTDWSCAVLTEMKFTYTIDIQEVLMSDSEAVTEGAHEMRSYSGILPAWEVQEQVGFWPHAIENGILQDGYTDYDYIASVGEGELPLEVGSTYVMLISTRLGDMTEYSRGWLYAVGDNGRLYTGDGVRLKRANVSLEDIRALCGDE